MASPANTVQIGGTEQGLRQTHPVDEKKAKYEALNDDQKTEVDEVSGLINSRERYGNDRKQKENEWTESFKMYVSWIDATLNPYLSNLFIPKTHEAVELLSAFLIGTNQSITASPENGSSDMKKAVVSGKWLDFLWRKTLKARLKILIWIKQAIVFGNGIIKVGWDPATDKPFMSVCAIEDVYFDFFEGDIQDSEYVFHEIRRLKADVITDEKYDLMVGDTPVRLLAIEGGPKSSFSTEALFATYDGSMKQSSCEGKVLVIEAWCKNTNELKTLLPTSMGWRVARRTTNPNFYKDAKGGKTFFRPFVKLRFKTSPLPNRAYDTGAVFPTIKIQKAFNDLINEYFDSVVLVNAPMWIKRRGARINPAELVRRPGGVVTVSDINKDLKQEQVGDVKSSIIEMLNRLDNEFQQASMVVNLLKGMGQNDTATEAQLGQENVQTLLDMIDQNIEDALSEVGQMVLAISLHNTEGIQSLKLYENDDEIVMLDFDPADIDGMNDIKIRPDRSTSTSKVVQQKQLLDFLKIISSDADIMARYPGLKAKIYRRWLDNGGIGDTEFFFQDEGQKPTVAAPGTVPAVRTPSTGEQITPTAIAAAAAPAVVA